MSGGSFERRPPAARRRVRSGVKLSGDLSALTGWVGRRWLELAEAILPADVHEPGLEYAKLGQTTTMAIEPGVVTAQVQGRRPAPYRTRWRVPAWTAEQWRLVLEAMAREAIYPARLLAGDLPPAVDGLLAGLGLQLLPAAAEIRAECTCPSAGKCKHAAAVAYLAAQRFDREPVAVLRLRGMPIEQVLDRLSVARAHRVRGVASAHAEPIEPAVPDGRPVDSIEAFWRPGPELAELRRVPPPHHAPHALLRRLGPSPLAGKFPLVGLLASVYDAVAAHAVHLRDRAERLDEERSGSP